MNIHKQAFSFVLIAFAGLAVTTAQADIVKRISQRDGPVVQGNDVSRSGHISANGNFVAFTSNANNLPSSGPVNHPRMVMVKNLTTGALSWQSMRGDSESPPLSNPIAMSGVTGNMCVGNSGRAYWENSNDNSVGQDPCPDNNFFSDIYFNGSYSPTFSSTSGGFCGNAGNGASYAPAISWDGTKVAFSSEASNFGPADTNNSRDIYVKTTGTGAIAKVSFSSAGGGTNGPCQTPALNADGTVIAYASTASNIVANDNNGISDVFVAHTGGANVVTERISVSTLGIEGNAQSFSPSISADGRYVVFASIANNLVSGDTNNTTDIFLRDRVSGVTRRISVATGGGQSNGVSLSPVISGDSRYIAYSSDASNLVTGDNNGVRDVYLFDRNNNVTTRISVTSAMGQSNGISDSPSISADGLRIVFESAATNMVAGDTNAAGDVFMYRITPPPANDSCGAAVPIALGLTPGTTLGAAADGNSICGTSAASADVYYTFTPARSAYVKFEVESGDYDAAISLHTGCPATIANQIACDDDSGAGNLPLIAGRLVLAGVPVTVRVTGFNGASGDFGLRLSEVAPVNDLCSAAIVLPVNSLVQTTNVGAGNEGVATCQSNSAADVYFSFTPTCSGTFTIDTFGQLDTVVSVHSACPATAANSIGCDDDGGPGFLSSLTLSLSGGTTYLVRAAGFSTFQDGFGILIRDLTTTNDECLNAKPISVGQVPFNNCAATPIETFSLCGAPASRDLWYAYLSTDSAVPVTISTGGSAFDTVLAVYDVCPNLGGTQIACNDDFFLPSRASLVRVNAPVGTPLWIRVAGWNTLSGIGVLTVSQCLADLASSDGPFPDGIVDGNDFVAFINSYGIGDPAVSPVADVNSDGIIDGNDFIAFINAFAAGC